MMATYCERMQEADRRYIEMMLRLVHARSKPACEACAYERRLRADEHGVWNIIVPPHAKGGDCRYASL